MALKAGQDPRGLPDREFYEFSVDAGMGRFYDASVAASFAHLAGDCLDQFHLPQMAFTGPASSPGART
jgi:hypothetical protein